MTKEEVTTLLGSIIACASITMDVNEVRDIMSWIVHEDRYWIAIEESVARGMVMGQDIAAEKGWVKKPNAH